MRRELEAPHVRPEWETPVQICRAVCHDGPIYRDEGRYASDRRLGEGQAVARGGRAPALSDQWASAIGLAKHPRPRKGTGRFSDEGKVAIKQ
jgi:hypothetical protein